MYLYTPEVGIATAIQWVSLLRIFSCRVATINRVERRGERLRVSSRRASTSTTTLAKKKNHPRDSRREERCSTCDIMLDQARSAQGKSRGQSRIGLALRWSRLIEHDITRGTAFFSPRISMMVLFFGQGSSTSSTCFTWLRCLRQCCCFLRCSGRCWENREKVLFSTDHGPNWRLLLSRRGSQLALSSWIWRAAQALTGKLKRRWK